MGSTHSRRNRTERPDVSTSHACMHASTARCSSSSPSTQKGLRPPNPAGVRVASQTHSKACFMPFACTNASTVRYRGSCSPQVQGPSEAARTCWGHQGARHLMEAGSKVAQPCVGSLQGGISMRAAESRSADLTWRATRTLAALTRVLCSLQHPCKPCTALPSPS